MEAIEVAVAVVREGGRFLVTRRPTGAHLERLWEFPGGKLEPGETAEECACRETLEETGLYVQIVSEIYTCRFDYPERQVHIHFFECRVVSGTLDSTRQEAKWVWLRELVELEMPAANAPVMRLILEQAFTLPDTLPPQSPPASADG